MLTWHCSDHLLTISLTDHTHYEKTLMKHRRCALFSSCSQCALHTSMQLITHLITNNWERLQTRKWIFGSVRAPHSEKVLSGNTPAYSGFLTFSWCLCEFLPGAPVPAHSPNTCRVNKDCKTLIGLNVTGFLDVSTSRFPPTTFSGIIWRDVCVSAELWTDESVITMTLCTIKDYLTCGGRYGLFFVLHTQPAVSPKYLHSRT